MSFGARKKSNGVDEQLQALIERESKIHEFQVLGHNITEICWEVCISTPNHYLSSSNKNCLVNCVERFIDTSNFIAYRLANIALSDPNRKDTT